MDTIPVGLVVFHTLNLLVYLLLRETDQYFLVLIFDRKCSRRRVNLSGGLDESNTMQRCKIDGAKTPREELGLPYTQPRACLSRPPYCK